MKQKPETVFVLYLVPVVFTVFLYVQYYSFYDVIIRQFRLVHIATTQ